MTSVFLWICGAFLLAVAVLIVAGHVTATGNDTDSPYPRRGRTQWTQLWRDAWRGLRGSGLRLFAWVIAVAAILRIVDSERVREARRKVAVFDAQQRLTEVNPGVEEQPSLGSINEAVGELTWDEFVAAAHAVDNEQDTAVLLAQRVEDLLENVADTVSAVRHSRERASSSE